MAFVRGLVVLALVTEKSWFAKKKKGNTEGAGREPPRTNRRSLQAHALCSVNFEMADCTSRSPGDSSKSTTYQLCDHNHMPTARAALAASTLLRACIETETRNDIDVRSLQFTQPATVCTYAGPRRSVPGSSAAWKTTRQERQRRSWGSQFLLRLC